MCGYTCDATELKSFNLFQCLGQAGGKAVQLHTGGGPQLGKGCFACFLRAGVKVVVNFPDFS